MTATAAMMRATYVGQRRCRPRSMYPYSREWIVTLRGGATGSLVRHVNFEQDEAAARAYAAAHGLEQSDA